MNKTIDFADGKDDISILPGTRNELVIFESRIGSSAFLQLLILNDQPNNRTLVSLNSNINIDKFLAPYRDFQGKLSFA